MKSIGEVLKLSSDFLVERQIPRAKRLAEEILSHALQLKKMDLYLQIDRPIVESELNLIREMLKRCGKNEPLEYIIGEVEFFNCRIKVDSRVLIPRPETELLVEMIAKEIETGELWDVCTGSGYIGIALKKARPSLQVALSDISSDALALAKENAEINRVEVELLEGDLLAPFKGRRADLIVCNPPYISQDEYEKLDPAVRDFEPKLALLGGSRGTEFYERLKNELPNYLKPNGRLYLEIGANQGEALKELFPRGTLHHDWAGHPRFFVTT